MAILTYAAIAQDKEYQELEGTVVARSYERREREKQAQAALIQEMELRETHYVRLIQALERQVGVGRTIRRH